MRSFSKFKPLCMGEKMFDKISNVDIIITAFILICAVLAGVVIFLSNEYRYLAKELLEAKKTVIIDFGLSLKDAKISDLGLNSADLPIRPEDFKINVEMLRKKLLHGYEVKKHEDTEVLAYCILEHAGIGAYVEVKSKSQIQDALTRLLLNEDSDAVKSFLSAVAQSICDSANK